MGAESERKAGQAGGKKSRSLQGSANARRAGETGASPPPGTGHPLLFPFSPGSARGCKGRSPLHKKTKNLPLPRRGRGLGGWGQKIKLKAG